MGYTGSYFYMGKDPAFAFGTGIPFGPNSRQMNGWFYQAGGLELLNEFYANYNLLKFPGGNTGTQMGGWFRREIKSVADINGLKMRIGGLAGTILQTMGLVPQQLAAGDTYTALERGALDAVEWVGPYDDEKLGFVKIAPYYYYPSFWEGNSALSFFINLTKWRELPPSYQSLLRACLRRGFPCAGLRDSSETELILGSGRWHARSGDAAPMRRI
jgi:TRAP-type mannitol/chloroaromatic compound transport system substrate-binding protein